MAAIVRMPSVLAGATEAAIANWLVKPGDSVPVGMPIAEIETEKAIVEYEAEQAGVVGRLVLGAGDTAEIGDPIAVLISAGETDADIDAALGVPSGSGAASDGTADDGTGSAGAPNGTAAPAAGRVFASPLVRKLAGERGVDLTSVSGTGPHGRVVRRDLERWLAREQPAPVPSPGDPRPAAAGTVPPAAPQTTAPETAAAGSAAGAAVARLIPHTPMRRAIARRLTESVTTAPHFYVFSEIVVDELLALRKRVNETSPVKVSVNDFVIAAAAAAFRDVPAANVTWTEDGLLGHDSVDIAIAVATADDALVTPVLRGVESKRLSQIARESADLAARARDKRLHQAELDGGTFSVSNLGMYGTVEFTAIINPPQSAILAVGAARQQPVVADGAVVPATVMRCTLSVDHRAIDGALAARWLAAFTAHMENPLGALI